ncbi:hypothetical protein [Embleya sp. NPDC059237]|uniref:hypothetical protein n=1 Tax=Embleya sp. NPDC059237 TaxID=3346784 RepID=UPI003680C364
MGRRRTWREKVAAEDAEQDRLRTLAEASALRRALAIEEGVRTEFGGNAAAMGRELGVTGTAVAKAVRRAEEARRAAAGS